MAKTEVRRVAEPDADGSSYEELQRRYAGQYVARRGGIVIAHADGLDGVWRQMRQAGGDHEGVVIEFVCRPDLVYALSAV